MDLETVGFNRSFRVGNWSQKCPGKAGGEHVFVGFGVVLGVAPSLPVCHPYPTVVYTVIPFFFSFFSSYSALLIALSATNTASAAMSPSVCEEAIYRWSCGCGEVTFVRVMLLFDDCNPPYCCAGLGTWIEGVI